MTLIAFAAEGKSAEIITDTSQYLESGAQLLRQSKLYPLHHLDTVVLVQGSTGFNLVANMQFAGLAVEAPDYDLLVEEAPETCRQSWEVTRQQLGGEPTRSVLFLIGYSPRREGFVARGFSSHDDFEPFDVDGVFCHPSPTSVRPSEWELVRLEEGVREGQLNPADLESLRSRPLPQVPSSRQQWVQLAKDARQRSFYPPGALKVYVTGDVHHTSLRRGEIRTKLVHTFHDQGEEFQRVVAGTLHPQAQLGPCPCGSGERMIDCCLPAHFDEPCWCRSGKPLRDCCLEATATPQLTGTEHLT